MGDHHSVFSNHETFQETYHKSFCEQGTKHLSDNQVPTGLNKQGQILFRGVHLTAVMLSKFHLKFWVDFFPHQPMC